MKGLLAVAGAMIHGLSLLGLFSVCVGAMVSTRVVRITNAGEQTASVAIAGTSGHRVVLLSESVAGMPRMGGRRSCRPGRSAALTFGLDNPDEVVVLASWDGGRTVYVSAIRRSDQQGLVTLAVADMREADAHMREAWEAAGGGWYAVALPVIVCAWCLSLAWAMRWLLRRWFSSSPTTP